MAVPTASARDRLRYIAAAVIVVGVLVYSYSVYSVLQAGGFTTTSQLGLCAEAASGRFRTDYRVNEQFSIERGYFPPSATCRWSGGSSAVLVPPTWTWTGIVIALAGVAGVVIAAVPPRRQ